MILAIEVLFLIAGLYALFTAKMPSMIVGKGFKAEGNKVRIIGGLMVALLPGILCLGFTLGLAGGIMDFDPRVLVTLSEIGIVIAAAIIVTLVIRNIRIPDTLPEPTNTENIEPQ
jgi:predicted lipid-binding transport protein (Tim44 family)